MSPDGFGVPGSQVLLSHLFWGLQLSQTEFEVGFGFVFFIFHFCTAILCFRVSVAEKDCEVRKVIRSL